MVSDGSGGAILAWQDLRSSTTYDVYASKVFSNGVLPVELISLDAQTKGSGVELAWKTATEMDNYGFEVERKTISGEQLTGNSKQRTVDSWVKVGFVEGGGTTNAPREYWFTDRNLTSGRYAYRLKQIDRDGAFKYSQSVEAEVGVAPKVFELSQNYPNPFNPSTTIEYSIVSSELVTVRVFDLLGREAASLVNERQEAGTYSVRLDASKLSSGFYYYTLSAGASVSTRRMLLLK
jgi:hypothetical protein